MAAASSTPKNFEWLCVTVFLRANGWAEAEPGVCAGASDRCKCAFCGKMFASQVRAKRLVENGHYMVGNNSYAAEALPVGF
eukprot:1183423-Prorocentrum_minimum.AAC.2